MKLNTKSLSKFELFLLVIPDSPHTIGVEFGTRIVDVMGKKVHLETVNF